MFIDVFMYVSLWSPQFKYMIKFLQVPVYLFAFFTIYRYITISQIMWPPGPNWLYSSAGTQSTITARALVLQRPWVWISSPQDFFWGFNLTANKLKLCNIADNWCLHIFVCSSNIWSFIYSIIWIPPIVKYFTYTCTCNLYFVFLLSLLYCSLYCILSQRKHTCICKFY